MLKLLREDVSSSFSELWYRVGPTRPRLSTHARVIRQSFGGRISHIVEDPAGGQYYRLSDSAYFFLGLLDGKRTVDDSWQACNAQLADDAPTQRECVELLSKLQFFGLLSGDQPLEPEMIELRRKEALTRRRQRRTGRGFSLTIPLVNPEPWLERMKHILNLVFSPWGAIVWAVVVLFALYCVFTRADAIANQLNGVLDKRNLLWLGVVFLVLRAWHELGHAAACKAMGGRCTEIGLMVIALVLPFPYCDASSAWRLTSVRQRVIVSAGGVIFETLVAALAAIAWSRMGDDDAGLTRTLLYNTMLVSGVTTLVFNLNPLLRYDGYYILSDITGIANMAQRAQELLRFLVLRRVFNVAIRPPHVRERAEFWLLLTYGLLSFPYRMLVLVTIILILWSSTSYMTLGAVLAVIGFAVWVVWPMLKAIGFLATSPSLIGRRARAIGIAGTATLVLVIVLGVIPMPAAGYASGTVEPIGKEPIRALEDGFVMTVHVRAGEEVRAGTPLVTVYNAEVAADVEMAEAGLMRAQAGVDNASRGAMTDRLLAERRLEQARAILDRARLRADGLVVRAPIAGRVVPRPGRDLDLTELEGRFLERGALLGSVVTADKLMVRCVVSDREHAFIFHAAGENAQRAVRTSIRVKGRASEEVEGVITRLGPAGSKFVSDRSLTTAAGGDILLDPDDPEGQSTLLPQFLVEVAPTTEPGEWQPGLRARVRFGVPARPLAVQWFRRFRQYLSERTRA